MYTYTAYVTKVYDGDTVTVDIDLGFGVWLRNQKLRLFGINAPEVRKTRGVTDDEKEFGKIVRDYVSELICYKKITIKTIEDKKGKYGRWLAKVNIVPGDQTLNNHLLDCEIVAPMEY
jgi:micrococcal nuclease